MLLRLAYLGVTNVFALLRLLSVSNQDKDAEILALRHQITVLERQLGRDRVRFAPGDRVFLAALLHRLPRGVLRRARLLVRPDTVLRRHRDLVSRRHAARLSPLKHRNLNCRYSFTASRGSDVLRRPGTMRGRAEDFKSSETVVTL
ncbi:hypothetical protein ACWD4G_16850 [Streptomyces sp. NPDC002643]